MKLSPKTGDATPVQAPKTTAQLLAILDEWELNCPDAGRAARFLRRDPPGRPVRFSDRQKAIEAYQLEKRTVMKRWSACMRVAQTMAGFNTNSKLESIARRLRNELAEMEADPATRKILDEIVLSISRSK